MNAPQSPKAALEKGAVVQPFSNRPRVVPLSNQQQAYWEAEQERTIGYRLIAGNEHVANTFGGLRVKGSLNVDVLRRSLNEVLRRHESLRTRIETIDGRPFQAVTDADEVPLECADVSHRFGADRESAAATAAARAALGRFDYTAGIMLRAHLVSLSDSDTVIVLVVPHIVSDSVSIQVLINEVLTLYAHFLHGKLSPLPEPGVQYADFVLWQQEWLRGDVSKAVNEYAVRRLLGARPVELPMSGRARSGPAAADAGELRFALDERLRTRVYALSTRQRVTPFVVMLGAFSVLLSQWSGQTDILLLAPFAARTDGTQKVIGLFSNLYPLRTDLSGAPPFSELLEQIQTRVLESLEYRIVPYAVLADSMRGRADLSCTGVGVNAVPDGGKVVPRGCAQLLEPGTRVTPYVIDTGRVATRQMRAHLSFWMGFAAGGGISGRLMHRRASFDAESMSHVVNALIAAIDVLTEQPHRRISDTAVAPGRALAADSFRA